VAPSVEQFLRYGQIDRRYARETQLKHRDCFASWILPAIGDKEVEEIELLDVLKIRNAMIMRGLSKARESGVLAALKVFLRFCQTALKVKCLDPSEIKLPRMPKPQVQFLTPDEIERVLAALNPYRFSDARLRALCELILGTGVRLGEALRMDRVPFDQDQSEIDIIGKGGKQRTIFFSDRCKFWVRQYLSSRADHHPALFITTGGQPQRWAREDVSKFFINLRRQAGIAKKLTPHLLRHTYCTTLLNNGVDITFIKELAGHEDIQTTARYYLGVDKNALRKIVKERLRYETPAALDSQSVPS
jgi:integrase/recombinase XerD